MAASPAGLRGAHRSHRNRIVLLSMLLTCTLMDPLSSFILVPSFHGIIGGLLASNFFMRIARTANPDGFWPCVIRTNLASAASA